MAKPTHVEGGRDCLWCGVALTGHKTKWCSNRCKKAAWYAEHAEAIIGASLQWKRRNPERVLTNARRYYQRHHDRIKEKQRARDRGDPERLKANGHRRRARLNAASGTWTRDERLRLVACYGGACAYCGAVGELTVDHRIPLLRGGSNAIDNIVPACRDCNSRKRAKHELEFRALLALETFERDRRIREARGAWRTSSAA